MRWRRIEVVVALFAVLPVIALGSGESKHPFFQNRVFPIPKREREAQPAFAVGDPQQSVLAPPVSAASGLIVREIIPAASPFRIILPHRAPLPFAQKRPPTFPIFRAAGVVRK